jgi:diguanylate cyclase (GGDEF)-like protein
MHILIADDSVVDRALLKGLLTRAGHEVIVAENGLEAWSILQTENAPQLAILDWQMPGLDGLEVCRRLRQIEGRPYVFVVLLSSNDERQQLLEGLRAGADDYMIKPAEASLLRARLEVAQRILALQSNLMAAHEKLRFRAEHDALTGLSSRAAVLEALEREINRARRGRTPLGVIIGDVDLFKRINDAHGHAAGDAALCEVARRLVANVRSYDTVGRLGGEEFLILLPGCEVSSLQAQAERLRKCICDAPFDLLGLQLPLTISLGGATLDPLGSESPSNLTARADAALYDAKHSGRNQVAVRI